MNQLHRQKLLTSSCHVLIIACSFREYPRIIDFTLLVHSVLLERDNIEQQQHTYFYYHYSKYYKLEVTRLHTYKSREQTTRATF